jgi:hypothetical protein
VIGAGIGALAGASEVLGSQTVRDLTAGSGIVFEDTGGHELKGRPGPVAGVPGRRLIPDGRTSHEWGFLPRDSTPISITPRDAHQGTEENGRP